MFVNKTVWLVASGDLRLSANQSCWEAQHHMEQLLSKAIENAGWRVQRAHDFNPEKKHGFIDSQRMGMTVFKRIPPGAPLIVAESVWQYSHHVLAGLTTHKGPILTVANWSGQWPGLVGLLNLNGSLTKAGVNYSTLWSEEFNDAFFVTGLQQWLTSGKLTHDTSHVKQYHEFAVNSEDEKIGKTFAQKFLHQKAIMGVFDEGCMGMYNAIVPDHLLHATGIFKERLSQSTLFARMRDVSDNEAEEILAWLLNRGMQFNWGSDPATELTREQTLEQCKMYIAALRIANEFGCDTIGIQYQQGLKDLAPASDLVEGLLNNADRPPAYSEDGTELYAGKALPHFNEVDECAGIDALITCQLWEQLNLPVENTLHDIRWGAHYKDDQTDDFIWVFLISGAAPPAHFIGGYAGASSERQPPMYFRLGGGTLKGISKPGAIVWSRIYVMNDRLHCDIGTGEAVSLSKEESNYRWESTTPQWPIMHAKLNGVGRDQLMAQHKANHIHVVYANDDATASRACRIKAAALQELGIEVHFCGTVQAV